MVFIEINLLRKITGLSREEYTDQDLQEFVSLSQKEITAQIQTRILREPIRPINSILTNKIDGKNKIFYLSKQGNYLGDRNYDGEINEGDVLVYLRENSGSEWLETAITPISVDPSNLSFTLEEAPKQGSELYVTYCYSLFDLFTPDPMISLAGAYLTASYLMITEGGDDDGRSIRIGNLSIGAGKGSPGVSFYSKFMEIMDKLMGSIDGGVSWGESYVQI